jgi:hypothetical protein
VQRIPTLKIPATYADWRHCIEHDCRQPLSAEFIAERLAALRDPANPHTRDFTRLYGEAHLHAVMGWFSQAASLVRVTG